jgi:ADP-heptose:LPS heptosyltransferase
MVWYYVILNTYFMRILIIQTAFIGDVILATALLETLHEQHPTAQIDLLVRKGNEGLLAHHPFLNELLVWDKSRKYGSWWELLKRVRQTHYDQVIGLQRFATMGLFMALSGAKQRIGFDKNPFSWAFTKRVPHDIGGKMHEVERNAQLAGEKKSNAPLRPKLYVDTVELPLNLPQKSYVCLAPTSVWFTKQFPESQWVAFIDSIPNTFQVLLMGAASDTKACEHIQTESVNKQVQNWAGKLNLLQSAKVMQGAFLNFVNDSAPMHLCSATNAPVCAIFCSTVPDFGFGPLSDFSRVVEIEFPLDCRPCGLHGHRACPQGHFRCGFDIRTAQLLTVLQERLSEEARLRAGSSSEDA